MRARYAAFVKGDAPFLIRTSHPMQRYKLHPGEFHESFALTWKGLRVLAVEDGGPGHQHGQVKFHASFMDPNGTPQTHVECSRFIHEQMAHGFIAMLWVPFSHSQCCLLKGISINLGPSEVRSSQSRFQAKNVGILVVFRGFLPGNIGCEGRALRRESFLSDLKFDELTEIELGLNEFKLRMTYSAE